MAKLKGRTLTRVPRPLEKQQEEEEEDKRGGDEPRVG